MTQAQAGNTPRQDEFRRPSGESSGYLSLPSHSEPGPSGAATSEPGPSEAATSESGPSGTATSEPSEPGPSRPAFGSPAYSNEMKELDTLISMFSTR